LNLPLSESITALKVIIDFTDHFHSVEYGADCQVNLSKSN